MRTVFALSTTVVVSTALGIGAQITLGGVPIGQTVPTPTFEAQSLNAVVQFDRETKSGELMLRGSGSIIGKGTDKDGLGYFWALTAAHVVIPFDHHKNATWIGFRNSTVPGGGSSAFNYEFDCRRMVHWGGPGPEDADYALVQISTGRPPDLFFDSIFPLDITSIADPIGVQFSSVGYGRTGNATADGYDSSLGSGTKRFQNNVVTGTNFGFTPGFLPNHYATVQWQLDDPGVLGEGYVWSGDSGSPLMFTNPIELGGIPNVFTDGIFGVVTGGIDDDGKRSQYDVVKFGDYEIDLLFTAADVSWLEQTMAAGPSACPEPSTLCLIASGALTLLVFRLRPQTCPRHGDRHDAMPHV